jgi:hypothetical protein
MGLVIKSRSINRKDRKELNISVLTLHTLRLLKVVYNYLKNLHREHREDTEGATELRNHISVDLSDFSVDLSLSS